MTSNKIITWIMLAIGILAMGILLISCSSEKSLAGKAIGDACADGDVPVPYPLTEGVCADGSVVSTCQSGVWSVYGGTNFESEELTCDDALDNDCDGKTDCADENCASTLNCKKIAFEESLSNDYNNEYAVSDKKLYDKIKFIAKTGQNAKELFE